MRRLAVSIAAGLAFGTAVVVTVELSDGPDVQTVEVTPARAEATAGPAQEPYRPADACRCRPVRVVYDGVDVPPPSPRLQVCALGSLACLEQDAGPVVDGPVTR